MNHPTTSQPAAQKPEAHGTQGACCTRRSILRSLPGFAAVTLTLSSTLGLLAGCEGKGKSFQVQGGEKRPVLNPYRFSDPRVQFNYAAAQKHPQVLDKLYCYCHCSRDPLNHKSLLSCYATTHGAG
jgi:hypothetical protein